MYTLIAAGNAVRMSVRITLSLVNKLRGLNYYLSLLYQRAQ